MRNVDVWFRRLDRAIRIHHGFVRHILDSDGRQIRVRAVVVGVVDERRAPAPRGKPGAAAISGRNRRLRTGHGTGPVVQFGKGVGEVLRMHELVGRILQLDLPAMGRARRGGDEEELAGVGKREVFVAGVDGGVLAEIDTEAVAHEGLAVPGLADADGRLVVEEGDDDAAEGAQGSPGVNGADIIDELADALQVFGAEDVEILEVGKEERVGRGRGLCEGREGGEVEG